jgi:hypothetical protein
MQINLTENLILLKQESDRKFAILESLRVKSEDFKSIEFSLFDCAKTDFSLLELFNVVYLIQVTDFGIAENGLKLCSNVATLKATKSVKFKLPKVNIKDAEGNILYIGKSTMSFRKRMEQHILGKSAQTFALHLDNWNHYPKKFENLRLKLFYTSIDFEKLNIQDHNDKKDLLEIVETSLHQKYKPLLGRTGH